MKFKIIILASLVALISGVGYVLHTTTQNKETKQENIIPIKEKKDEKARIDSPQDIKKFRLLEFDNSSNTFSTKSPIDGKIYSSNTIDINSFEELEVYCNDEIYEIFIVDSENVYNYNLEPVPDSDPKSITCTLVELSGDQYISIYSHTDFPAKKPLAGGLLDTFYYFTDVNKNVYLPTRLPLWWTNNTAKKGIHYSPELTEKDLSNLEVYCDIGIDNNECVIQNMDSLFTRQLGTGLTTSDKPDRDTYTRIGTSNYAKDKNGYYYKFQKLEDVIGELNVSEIQDIARDDNNIYGFGKNLGLSPIGEIEVLEEINSGYYYFLTDGETTWFWSFNELTGWDMFPKEFKISNEEIRSAAREDENQRCVTTTLSRYCFDYTRGVIETND